MKRLLSMSLALALVYSISFPARAELLKNFKTDGNIEVKSFGIDNEVDRDSLLDDYRSDIRTRIMVGGSFDLLDDVHGRVLLRKNNKMYGRAVNQGANGSETAQDVQNAVAVDNAYVKIDKVFGEVDLTMGRQFYGNPTDLVIYFGPNPDDLLSVNALDIFRADASVKDWAKVTGIAGKTNETTPAVALTPSAATTANTDTDLWGVDVNSDKVIPAGNLGAYYYTQKTHTNAGLGNNTLIVYGLRASGDIKPVGGLSYSAEVAMNGGRNRAVAAGQGYRGNAVLLGAKYAKEVKAMPIRASVEWGISTSSFTAIAPGKRFGIIWGEQTGNFGPSTLKGGTTVTGLSNLKVMSASVGIDPIKKLGVDLSWYRFQKADKLNGMSGIGAGLTSLGTEYDLVVSWKHSDNVTLSASAASFQVGDALRPATVFGTNHPAPINRLGADIKIKF